MCLLSLVEFLCSMCWNDVVWFLYLVMKSFSLSPHVFFCWQLQVLVSFVLVLTAVSLMCLHEFKMCLLWLSMISA